MTCEVHTALTLQSSELKSYSTQPRPAHCELSSPLPPCTGKAGK